MAESTTTSPGLSMGAATTPPEAGLTEGANATIIEAPNETLQANPEEDRQAASEEAQKGEQETPEQEQEKQAERVPEPTDLPENLQKFVTEFGEAGSLSEDSYTELSKLGFGRDVVDAYLEATTSRVSDERQAELVQSVGGPEKLAAMVEWGRNNLTPEQVAIYDAGVSNAKTAPMALEWLRSQMEGAVGRDPGTRLEGTTSQTVPADVFRSEQEVVKAMRDPRYGKDRAYTKSVEQKIARSEVL